MLSGDKFWTLRDKNTKEILEWICSDAHYCGWYVPILETKEEAERLCSEWNEPVIVKLELVEE